MHIEINRRADGMFEVRTTKGGYMLCDNAEQARVYASAFADGWNAARNSIDKAYWTIAA